MAGFRRALDPVARRIRPDALVLLESTLPPGTTRSVVVPLFRTVFRARGLTEEPLIAHAFERVMPGPDYATSIHSFWRCFAGASPPAAARARAFLETLVDTRRYPLTELASTTASEVTKVLENSYRAMNIAFIDEWSRAAESVGVDLFEVVAAIRKRAGTHDNIRQPGFGVGGYCLPKDGLVAEWGLRELLGYAGDLPMTRDALGRNRRMPLHALELLRNALGGTLDGRRVGIAGVSYRAAVGDTRNSPAAVFADGARREGASVVASDPRVGAWPERPAIPLVELDELLARCDAVVFGVAHREWRELAPERFGSRPLTVVDAAGLVPDGLRDALVARGHTVVGVGRGDWMPGGTDAAGGGGP
jgi:nucleotide sugar dehydrogenase